LNRITACELFDDVQDRLALRWVAGQSGGDRTLQSGAPGRRRPAEAGYLNIIYPNNVQIIGSAELDYLDGLDARQRWRTVQNIFAHKPIALVITKDQEVPADLRDTAEETGTPLWLSARRGHDLLTFLQYHLARALAPQVTLHGVFMEVYSIGVMITGSPGSGKSELALELITRGHRLVADDAPEFTLVAPDLIDGACPEILRDLLEVRGLGVLNVREMFGHTAVKHSKYLRLIVHLKATGAAPKDAMVRLTGDLGAREVLDVKIPQITIPVAPGRNLAVLVEAAVRSHALKSQGIDQATIFMDRQAARLRRQSR
jgi:HPr kinase/phosphorylase